MSEHLDRLGSGENEQLTDLLGAVAAAASGAAVPQGAAAARQRGRQRRVRRLLALAAVPVVLAAAGTAAGLGLSGGPTGHAPLPAVTGTAPATVVPSPPPSASAQASPSATPTGAPSVALQLPSTLAESALNQATLTVTDPGAATTETVTLSLGIPRATTPNASAPDEQAVAERLDPASGAWVTVPVRFVARPGGGWVDQATFTLALPAGGRVTQQLRLLPLGDPGLDLGVRLDGSGHAPVTATYPVVLTGPTLSVTGPADVVTGQTSGEFDVTLADDTPASYTGVQLRVDAGGSSPNCTFSPFPTVQWSEGGAWHTTSTAATSAGWPLLETVALTPGRRVVLRLRLPVPAGLPSCLAKGEVAVSASTGPIGAAGATTPPPLSLLADSPFFSVRHG
ncbi:hypothetical protein [Streptacidiphilus jiangxiensis]|uniref:Uncharacterized protein n=1 Tax=Streptacidiphilus jiangxiensis TaxID=235985 RepID=A0A1H7N1C9_STRJI|nr:hypothetical protein [Streptacidiphilus jiangxiensis]SEL17303.1 hypothetical protein SAMN05414137_106169 [Streptacidiphilus jiangxiensis]